jgi:hypothetical protein
MTEPKRMAVEIPPLPTCWLKMRDNDGVPVGVWREFHMHEYARAYATACVLAEREAICRFLRRRPA